MGIFLASWCCHMSWAIRRGFFCTVFLMEAACLPGEREMDKCMKSNLIEEKEE